MIQNSTGKNSSNGHDYQGHDHWEAQIEYRESDLPVRIMGWTLIAAIITSVFKYGSVGCGIIGYFIWALKNKSFDFTGFMFFGILFDIGIFMVYAIIVLIIMYIYKSINPRAFEN